MRKLERLRIRYAEECAIAMQSVRLPVKKAFQDDVAVSYLRHANRIRQRNLVPPKEYFIHTSKGVKRVC